MTSLVKLKQPQIQKKANFTRVLSQYKLDRGGQNNVVRIALAVSLGANEGIASANDLIVKMIDEKGATREFNPLEMAFLQDPIVPVAASIPEVPPVPVIPIPINENSNYEIEALIRLHEERDRSWKAEKLQMNERIDNLIGLLDRMSQKVAN